MLQILNGRRYYSVKPHYIDDVSNNKSKISVLTKFL